MAFLNHFKVRALSLAIFATMAVSPLSAADFDWYNGRWAQETSDIAPDPSVTFGYLKNGLRWAYVPNSNPKGRLTIRLNVQVGSLMEEEKEYGISHYLEHMAFNGSENYPAGSLIPFFQKHGMSFGGDTNAHTSFAETVFKLNLTKLDDESISEGLSVLRDMADGLTLSAKEIDEERGIIFSEKRAGEEEYVLAMRKWEDRIYGQTRFIQWPIGTTEALNGINEKIMRNYYDKWYVPGRMTVVVVGEADPKKIEKLIDKAFGSMKAEALPEIPDVGEPDRRGTSAFVLKRPVTGTNVGIYMLWPHPETVDNEARQRENIIATLINRAISMRLMVKKEEHADILTLASYTDSHNDWYCPAVHFNALTQKDHWKDALSILQAELLRARDYGMTASEFETVKRQQENALRRNLAQRSSWTNEDYASLFIGTINYGQVFTSNEQDLERYLKNIETLTLDEVNVEMKRLLSQDNRRLKLTGDIAVSEKEVLDYWKTIEGMSVQAPDDDNAAVFPYLDMPEKGEPLTFEKIAYPVKGYDLGMERAVMKNGTEIILQPLPFEKGTVIAHYLFGDGTLGVEDKDVPVVQFADRLLYRGGIGKLTEAETSQIFSGTGIGVMENAADTYNEIMGNATSKDVKKLLEAVWTQFKDPTLRESYRQNYLNVLKRIEYDRTHEVQGTLDYHWDAHFTGERKAAYNLSYKDAIAIPLEATQNYLNEVRKRGKRVLIIAGDFDREVAIETASRLFGNLPAPEEKARRLGLDPVFTDVKEKVMTVDSVKKDKVNLMLGWHLDMKDPGDRRTFAARSLASSIVNDRLRVIVREKLAAAYSPYCFYNMDPEQKGFGMFVMEIQTTPEQTETVRQALASIGEDILKNGITSEELERLRKPRITSWETQHQRNFFWTVLQINESMYGKPYIKWFEDLGDHYKNLTREEVEHEAQAFFEGEQSTLIVKSK